ncbi:MAG TPA: hypothetical protein VNR40_19940 [Steroidobacter sp.]|nr:hypothetical protein [Steroidobacter sp.]
MAAKLDDLLIEILHLPSWERRQLLEWLVATESRSVRDGGATYQGNSMRFVTVALPDDLARQAQDAGLLGNKTLEGILRRALQSHGRDDDLPSAQQRRLVEKNGYLVAEALPGEARVTAAQIRDILNDMEW